MLKRRWDFYIGILWGGDCACGGDGQSWSTAMQDTAFDEVVEQICKEDGRFDRRAYTFLRQGLDYTVKELVKRDEERARKSHHVSGPELLTGLREYALDQFGPLAGTVLKAWGITRCRDFGDIVFNLIEYGVFSKTAEDRVEDFSEIYTFEEAFVQPFLPKKPLRHGREPSSSATA